MVSHLDVVVGLCSDDPKDFYNLQDRSILRARLAVDIDIHEYIHEYIHVWISDFSHPVDIHGYCTVTFAN